MDALVSVVLSLALAPGAPPPGEAAAPTEAAETIEEPVDAGPPTADPIATDSATPPVEPPAETEPAEPTESEAKVESSPPPPPPKSSTPFTMKRVDGEAREKVRSGQRVMNVSGIVMASGGLLLLTGVIATLAAGRPPDAAEYNDIEAYRKDNDAYTRRTAAGGILSAIGALGVIGGGIAFTIGGIRYLRGKKQSRASARVTPAGAIRF